MWPNASYGLSENVSEYIPLIAETMTLQLVHASLYIILYYACKMFDNMLASA